ncbi:hypothetical protein HMPREF0322_03902 [Desulfitobacterium hafniense DP7]|uniref:Uncharacterized protein n=1 Tax=Desulfitobacterium hafniense DP7 TaxID=537010 RepID=G9XSK8_DESHA|nr:hypothetical protein HMPREF0322_03902 [Desulfitobacterium hafniense DP7]
MKINEDILRKRFFLSISFSIPKLSLSSLVTSWKKMNNRESPDIYYL